MSWDESHTFLWVEVLQEFQDVIWQVNCTANGVLSSKLAAQAQNGELSGTVQNIGRSASANPGRPYHSNCGAHCRPSPCLDMLSSTLAIHLRFYAYPDIVVLNGPQKDRNIMTHPTKTSKKSLFYLSEGYLKGVNQSASANHSSGSRCQPIAGYRRGSGPLGLPPPISPGLETSSCSPFIGPA